MMDEGKQETKIHKYTFDNLKRNKKNGWNESMEQIEWIL